MTSTAAPASPDDDAPLAPLLDAIAAELPLMANGPPLTLAGRMVERARYLAALARVVAVGRADPGRLPALLADEWEIADGPGEVLVTSYYEPLLRGARAPTAALSQPLYALPPPELRGATRGEIDLHGALAGRGLELCWVDPWDAFVLHTEGSGTVELDGGGTLALDVAGHNGLAHRRLGPLLKDAIAPRPMNLFTMEAYLRGLPVDHMRRILAENPRYIYFRPRRGAGAVTSMGAVAVAGRTVATDTAQKGALAWLDTTQPRFGDAQTTEVASWAALHRLVIDQDRGAGIVGARVDLFWGRGSDARRYAGVMKQPGRLRYLVPRQ